VEALEKYIMDKLGRKEIRKKPAGFEEEKDPTDVVQLTKATFKESINGPKLVFVQYWVR
jgi:hypothetical protein